jgi:hypothetical protein
MQQSHIQTQHGVDRGHPLKCHILHRRSQGLPCRLNSPQQLTYPNSVTGHVRHSHMRQRHCVLEPSMLHMHACNSCCTGNSSCCTGGTPSPHTAVWHHHKYNLNIECWLCSPQGVGGNSHVRSCAQVNCTRQTNKMASVDAQQCWSCWRPTCSTSMSAKSHSSYRQIQHC